jgi:hypothetical protein
MRFVSRPVFRRAAAVAAAVWLAASTSGVRAQPAALAVSEAEAREWLTYLASDELEGREVFTEGYQKAAAFVARHLGEWRLRPLGDNGTFLQTVSEHRYRVTRRSSLTVEVGGESRTFRHGDHVEFPLESGASQTLRLNDAVLIVESRRPGGSAADIAARTDLAGRLVVYVPDRPGSSLRRDAAGDDLDLPTRLVRRQGAAAVVTFIPAPPPRAASTPPGRTTGESGSRALTSEITTVDRLDGLVPPSITADETVFDFLFSGSGQTLRSIRERADAGDAVAPGALARLSVTFNVDNSFEVLSTRTTANVVGMVEGADQSMRESYVIFGAHLDHVGASRGSDIKGRVNNRLADDRIWNGADDNGSGSVGLMALAKSFATGPRPRRSVVFVWHAGEETGLLGSRYMVSYPVVPLDHVEAMVNIDMIGRNRDDRSSEGDTVYVIGADRISTDLHNALVRTNEAMPAPLSLDFEYNDPADVQSFYTRSDHFSYADRGIPIAFFFTGTHDDYHANSDAVDRILFPKLLRVTDLIYEFGFAVADAPARLERDRLGPRAGRGFSGLLGGS